EPGYESGDMPGNVLNSSNLNAEIRRRLEWQYPYRAAEGLPSKMSVTEIKEIDIGNTAEGIKTKDNTTINRAIKENAILELPPLPDLEQYSKDFTAAEKGSIVHFVMQHLNLSLISSVFQEKNGHNYDMLLINLKQQIEDMVKKELITEKEADVVDYEKIITFLNSEIGQRVLAAYKVKREAPFVIKKEARKLFPDLQGHEETILVQGIIDCYFIEKKDDYERIVLLDYKTDYVFQGRIERIKQKYQKQLEIYREALEKILKRSVDESYIYLFDSGDIIAI
ncbi:MAG: PD-(D/E)XK nuclease family protein, partial [Halanaerobiales bacterium]